jgi:hypothetical protein
MAKRRMRLNMRGSFLVWFRLSKPVRLVWPRPCLPERTPGCGRRPPLKAPQILPRPERLPWEGGQVRFKRRAEAGFPRCSSVCAAGSRSRSGGLGRQILRRRESEARLGAEGLHSRIRDQGPRAVPEREVGVPLCLCPSRSRKRQQVPRGPPGVVLRSRAWNRAVGRWAV